MADMIRLHARQPHSRSQKKMPITKGFRALVDEAMAQVTTYSVAEAQARLADPQVQIVDIRDVRELEREGTVPGALLAPRGMLEFWVDPASPYFKPVFGDEGKQFILFCGAGWRSALATKTLQDMGMTNVAHIDGGFAEWKKQGAPMETLEAHKQAHAARRPAKG
jgi:rhodanese-related sulfurtransferase